jgi:para-nitrobenzyl esterase
MKTPRARIPEEFVRIISRRALIQAAGIGFGAATSPLVNGAASCPPDTGAIVTTPPEAIVPTTRGHVRGFRRGSTYVFRGIPYGRNPSGARRFLPAEPPEPWTEVRPCLAYGSVCPQPARDWSTEELSFIADWNDGRPGEDCLTLNVWSDSLGAKARRPVLVWLHGGGYTSGSSHELPSYDGARLAARGLVVVSLNHRLGAFGFVDLSNHGPAYENSCNVGMLDIVVALRWIRDNIEAFGGDPHRVTIAGQSGGGGKVSALMAMREARGLFHRAVVMSGSFAPALAPGEARRLSDALIRELSLPPGSIDSLAEVPASALVAAGVSAVQAVYGPASIPGLGRGRLGPIKSWAPTADGDVIVADAWRYAAPALSADVPMLIGNVRDEFKLSSMVFDEARLASFVSRTYGDAAPRLLSALAAEFPDLSSNERAGVVCGTQFHNAAVDQCRAKARQGAAPVYQYWFTYAPPDLLDGRIGAPHCAEIPYFFDNVALCDQQTGNTVGARQLAALMSTALVEFASTGEPRLPGISWAAFTESRPDALVFARTPTVVRSPGGRYFEIARNT